MQAEKRYEDLSYEELRELLCAAQLTWKIALPGTDSDSDLEDMIETPRYRDLPESLKQDWLAAYRKNSELLDAIPDQCGPKPRTEPDDTELRDRWRKWMAQRLRVIDNIKRQTEELVRLAVHHRLAVADNFTF